MKSSLAVMLPVLIFSLFNRPVYSQEMLGATLGNYSGVNGTDLNPSFMLNSKPYLDINFLAADIFLQSNFLYMNKHEYRVTSFFKSGLELPSHTESYGPEVRNFYTFPNSHARDAYVQLRINGPGAMILYGKHALAISTGVRSVVSATHVPYDVANFAYLGLDYKPQQNIDYQDNQPFKIGELTWAEVGISYAYNFYARNRDKFSAGITVRRLFGYSGFYLVGNRLDYVVPNDSSISIHNFDGQLGYSAPIGYDNNQPWNNKLFSGGGFSGDIGATYTRLTGVYSEDYFTSLCSQQYNDYLYRISVALIDVGAIRFKDHAARYSIDSRGSYWDNINDFHFHTIQQLMDTVSYRFDGNNQAAYRGNSFYMWLPSALTVQFDYHYYKNWYVNALFVYGFDLSPASVSRPSEIAITPRYESRGFEADMPVSFYDWNKLRIGLALRYYYVTIGTEKLGQFFRISNFTGLDFYLAVHFFIDKGDCPSTRQKGCTDIDYRVKSSYR